MVPALPPTKTLLWLIVGFFALTFLVYGVSLRNDFVNFDDGMLITGNPAIREISPQSLKVIFTQYDPELYIPLTLLSYQVDFALGGEHAFVYHLTNLLFHTLNALLVMWLFYLLTKGSRGIALLAGLLFALHPIQVEAVSWAAARKDVLSSFFFLVALIGYLYYRDSGERRTYWLSVGAFFLGLLAKASILMLPLALLLLDWREGRKATKETLLEKLPYFALSVVFGIVALFGKGAVFTETSLMTKILLACRSAVFYLQKFFWPAHLSVLYPYDGAVTLTTPAFLLAILALIVILGLTLWTLRSTREIAFGVAFYFLILSPSFTNLAKSGDLFLASDRYAYLAMLGLLWVVILFVSALLSSVPLQATMRRNLGAGIVAVLVAVLGWQSYTQSLTWDGPKALFSHVLALYPDSAIAHGNVGSVFVKEGKFEDAAAELEKAVASKPKARTLAILGSVYRKLGRDADATAAFTRAISLEPNAPEPYAAMAAQEASAGRTATAIELYGKAIAADPTYLDAWVNRGSLYLERGELDASIVDAREALKIQSLSAEARFNLAIGLLRQGKKDEALRELAITVKYRGNYLLARLQYGVLLHDAGRTDEAIAQFKEVLRQDPTDATARSALKQLGAGS